MSKLETNTIDTISGSTTLTLGGTNATTIAQDSATTITGLKSTGIDDNATSTAITIDSSENVGIGTTPDAWTSSWNTKALNLGDIGSLASITVSTGDRRFEIGNNVYTGTDNSRKYRTTGAKANYLQLAEGRFHFQSTNSTGTAGNNVAFLDKMVLDSNGELDVNVDRGDGTAISAFNILPYGTNTGMYNGVQIATDSARSFMGLFRQTTSDSAQIKFYNTNGRIGSINTSGTSTSYNTSSDYRLKENVTDITDATTRLKQLQPKRFNFIADADTTVDGFIAHEVQDIVPEAISGEKDETETKEKVVINSDGLVIAENIEQADWEAGKIVDEDGNTQYPTDSTWEATKVVPVYQGIDQAKLVPLLVKTIQELEARITQLENA